MRTFKYRGCRCTETRATADISRPVFGRPCLIVARLWRIKGRYTVFPGERFWLTSAAQCRSFIRGCDELAEAERRSQLSA